MVPIDRRRKRHARPEDQPILRADVQQRQIDIREPSE
jgi:hypothetical protein